VGRGEEGWSPGLAFVQEDLVEEPPLFGECSLVFEEEVLDVVEYDDVVEDDLLEAGEVFDDCESRRQGQREEFEVEEYDDLVDDDLLESDEVVECYDLVDDLLETDEVADDCEQRRHGQQEGVEVTDGLAECSYPD
jgi:hypothetical protein